MRHTHELAHECGGSDPERSSSLLCRILPIGLKYDVSAIDPNDGRTVDVVFSSQSTDAIVYVTVVLIIYIIIFLVLVITSYRKSVTLSTSLNYNLRSQTNYGATTTMLPMIVDCDSNGRVHTETLEEGASIQESVQL